MPSREGTPADPGYAIEAARTAPDLADARQLFEAYAAGIGVDLAYQGFAAELAGLPGRMHPLRASVRPDLTGETFDGWKRMR